MKFNLSCWKHLGWSAALLVGWGCGAVSVDNPTLEGSGGDDAAQGATLQLECGSDESITFPPLAKACVDESDCVLIFHRVDCCKTMFVYSINQLAEPAFGDVEGVCSQAFGGCGCKSLPYTAEDGNEVSSMGTLAVKCEANVCSAYVLQE